MVMKKALKISKKISIKMSCLINRLILKLCRVDIGNNLIATGIVNVKNDEGRISIGNDVVIHSGKYSIPIGYPERVSLWTLGKGRIIIGNSCGISNSTFCSAAEIQIGNNVLFGGGVKVYDTDFHSLDYIKRRDIFNDDDRKAKPIIIEDDVFIGAGTVILKGTIIGKRSIIGAGSVVSGVIPPDEIWGGNPARKIRGLINDNNVDYKC